MVCLVSWRRSAEIQLTTTTTAMTVHEINILHHTLDSLFPPSLNFSSRTFHSRQGRTTFETMLFFLLNFLQAHSSLHPRWIFCLWPSYPTKKNFLFAANPPKIALPINHQKWITPAQNKNSKNLMHITRIGRFSSALSCISFCFFSTQNPEEKKVEFFTSHTYFCTIKPFFTD